ncbi:MAG: DUF2974 domain-containing protein [Ruminococcus flavefaciens]|nr:DUF2974 domain-containing protein [Ruminococcus flavefaciens]
MGLSNYQLVLLDNLIYVESIKNRFDEAKEKTNADQEVTLGKIISELKKDLENAEQEEKEENPEKSEILLTCDMSKQEWLGILNAIAGDEVLKNLKIYDIQDNNNDDKSDNDNGFRAMTLVGEDENIIIFRGTSTNEEWVDNGQGGYSEITNNQAKALAYVNSIDLVNSNPFVVSGHSKGGNLAQYVTLFATDTLIDRCLSFDGQGFSNELCSTQRYQEALERNGDKLYMIASDCEPVNILFNTAIPEDHRMYIKANHEEGIYLYHKNNNILSYDENGMVNGFN